LDKWTSLLTPSAAVLALLLAIALVIQAIRHGRSVRRLESRLAEREGAAARVSLDRLAQLQRRAGTSTGLLEPKRSSPRLPPLGNLAAVVGVLAVVTGTGWYLFIRDDGGSKGAAKTTKVARTNTSSTTAVQPKPPSSDTTIPAVPEALPQARSAYTILVLNGSGVTGAAANMAAIVQGKGWDTAPPTNATNSDEKISFVVYLPGKEAIADNLAKDLGITKKAPQDGVPISQDASDVDAVVIVGLDLAKQSSP
jgi:LytR cell envelope-related transcriptional attenuator